MESTTPNHHIRSYLDYYTQMEGAPGYAVLISRAWGVGKSWLLRDYIASKKANQFLLVSVYGAASADEIAERIFAAKYPWLYTKGAVIAGRIVKAALKVGLKIDFPSDEESGAQIGVGGDLSHALAGKPKAPAFEGRTLVLDDIERCPVEGKQLWGFINHLVEHEGAKVILISHEGEIDDTNYRRIKEKNIGMTLEVIADPAASLDSFIAEQRSAIEPLREHRALVLRTFETSECESLRVLRFAVRDFGRVFDNVSTDLRGSPEIVANMLVTTLAFAIEFHSANLLPTAIQRLPHVRFMPRDAEMNAEDKSLKTLIDQYADLVDLSSPLPSLAWWELFFARGEADPTVLNDALRKRYDAANQERPSWLRLWHRTGLTDSEFENLLNETWNDLESHRFRVIGPLLHVAALHLWAIDEELSVRDRNALLAIATDALADLDPEELLADQAATHDEDDPESDSHFGLVYASRAEDFVKLAQHAQTLTLEALEAHSRLEGDRLAQMFIKEGARALAEALRNRPVRGGVVAGMKVDVFVDTLLGLSPPDQNRVISALGFRMRTERDPRELEWLRQVAHLISQPVSPPSLRRYILAPRFARMLR